MSSMLDYIIHEQCYEPCFGPIGAKQHIGHTFDDKREKWKKKLEMAKAKISTVSQLEVLMQKVSKTAECQTDPGITEDFEWELTERNDKEKGISAGVDVVNNLLRAESPDGLLETQVISQNLVSSFCQTSWSTNDMAVQVTPELVIPETFKIPLVVDCGTQFRESDLHRINSNQKASEGSGSDQASHFKSQYFGDLSDSFQLRKSYKYWNLRLQRTLDEIKSEDVSTQTGKESELIRSIENVHKKTLSKEAFIGNIRFEKVDRFVKENVNGIWYKSLKKLVKHLQEVLALYPEYSNRQDLITVRAIYIWICDNIRYDARMNNHNLTTIDILRYKSGDFSEFTKLFSEMCELVDIETRIITGFVKKCNNDPVMENKMKHSWNVVRIERDWHLLDASLGSGCWPEASASHVEAHREFFFLTDPDELIFSHYPHSDRDPNYCQWQLLPNPCQLSEFNSKPKLLPEFFQMSLELLTPVQSPIKTKESETIQIKADGYVRYQHKMHPWSELESDFFNNYCYCEVNITSRSIATFEVAPPVLGLVVLKIFGRKEEDDPLQQKMDLLGVFLFNVIKTPVNLDPWPVNNSTWGLTNDFYSLGVSIVIDDLEHWSGSKISVMDGNRRMFKFIHKEGPIMVACHLYDSRGCELLQELDKKTGKGVLFMMSPKNPLPREEIRMKERNGELKPFVMCKVTKMSSTFTILSLPYPGFHKLEIFAAKTPTERAKVVMPLVACFLVKSKRNPLVQPPGSNKEETDKRSSVDSGSQLSGEDITCDDL